MSRRLAGLLPALAAAAAPALEIDRPQVRFADDCTVALTMRLLPYGDLEPARARLEIAAEPTYRRLGLARPAWVADARLRTRARGGEVRLEVASAAPLPAHPSTLLLAAAQPGRTPRYQALTVPPCDRTGKTRAVLRGDALWRIADEELSGRDLDRYRLMLAIQLYNRDAFIGDNMNLVRAGARLHIPSPAEVARLALRRDWAVQEFRRQQELWRDWRRNPAALGTTPYLRERRLRIVPLDEVMEPPPPAAEAAAPATPEPLADPPAGPVAEPAPELPAEPAPEPAPAMEMQAPELAALGAEAADRGRLSWRHALAILVGLASLLALAWLVLELRRRAAARRAGLPEDLEAAGALDLARGCMEVGELDRARALLDQARARGGPGERAEARRLRARLRTARGPRAPGP